MKGKQLILVLMLLIASCKVSEKKVVGYYHTDGVLDASFTINPDHSFSYSYFNSFRQMNRGDNMDSCHFMTSGHWIISGNKLVLNSMESPFADTGRIRRIVKAPTKSLKSTFSFKDIDGNKICFNAIDDEKGRFAAVTHRPYSDYTIDLAGHTFLKFNLLGYKPLVFTIDDARAANYTITVSPYYKQGYFTNIRLEFDRNRLFNNDGQYFKSDPVVANVDSTYTVHGPATE